MAVLMLKPAGASLDLDSKRLGRPVQEHSLKRSLKGYKAQRKHILSIPQNASGKTCSPQGTSGVQRAWSPTPARQVIKGDFARSIKETKAAEDQAQRDFIEFERETKMSITTKETGLDHTDRAPSQSSALGA